MGQNKQEQERLQEKEQQRTQLNNMIYFQNLIPGKQQSPLIDDFRAILDTEENEQIKRQREALLMESPPILSFRDENQKKKFYDEESRNCQQFCCGSLGIVTAAALDDIDFVPKNNYMFSSGNGQYYEGSQGMVDNAIKENIVQETFGSASQQHLMDGLRKFDASVIERSASSVTVETDAPELAEMKSPNPFDMTLKPTD